MATHLTLARALRGTGASRPEGRVAEAILAFLAGRQRDALDQLTALEATRTGENQASWIRALRLRITSDWRLVAEPAQATAGAGAAPKTSGRLWRGPSTAAWDSQETFVETEKSIRLQTKASFPAD